MNSYVCVQLDSTGCVEWAQTWNIAALSIEDALTISGVIVSCWAVAFGCRIIVNFLLNRGN